MGVLNMSFEDLKNEAVESISNKEFSKKIAGIKANCENATKKCDGSIDSKQTKKTPAGIYLPIYP